VISTHGLSSIQDALSGHAFAGTCGSRSSGRFPLSGSASLLASFLAAAYSGLLASRATWPFCWPGCGLSPLSHSTPAFLLARMWSSLYFSVSITWIWRSGEGAWQHRHGDGFEQRL
jgi:hypothetical protein